MNVQHNRQFFENHDAEYTDSERERVEQEGYLGLGRSMPRTLWCRIGYSIRGYMYFVDACPSEVLDIARSLWMTGAVDYISIRVNYMSRYPSWKWLSEEIERQRQAVGGYSNSGVYT